MTDRLQEIRNRLSAATPGPWDVSDANEGMYECGPFWMVTNDAFHNPSHDPPRDDDEPWIAVEMNVGTVQDAEFIANAPADIAYLLDRLARYETAFAGLWVGPDGNGTQTVWRLTDPAAFGIAAPSALLRSSEVNRSIWAALAAVLPTEPPTQGAE